LKDLNKTWWIKNSWKFWFRRWKVVFKIKKQLCKTKQQNLNSNSNIISTENPVSTTT